jgi:hypothetical protein
VIIQTRWRGYGSAWTNAKPKKNARRRVQDKAHLSEPNLEVYGQRDTECLLAEVAKERESGVLTKPNVELTSHASSTDMSASTSTMRTSIKSARLYVSIRFGIEFR